MPGHRTPRKGLPKKALRTERLEKVKHIRLLMSSGLYQGEVTKAALAQEWGISDHTIDAYTEEASRSIQLDAEEGAPELLRRLFAMLQTISGDCVSRVQSETDEKGRSVVGHKGKMSHQAAAQYYATAIQGVGGMAALLGKDPVAFMSPKQRSIAAAGGPALGMPRQSIEIVVRHANVPDEPPHEAPKPNDPKPA